MTSTTSLAEPQPLDTARSSAARYLPHGPFFAELQRRVAQYFAQTRQVQNDSPRVPVKTAILLGWLAASYALLVFVAHSPWAVVALCISLGLAMGGIGLNIQHEGNHGSYSKHRWLNVVAGLGLDLLGGSSYVWRWKHNVLHHSNPNIVGSDQDLEFQPFCRMAPSQPRRAIHRYQHLYMWFLYGLMAVTWHFVDDFKNVAVGRIGKHRFPRPRGWNLVGLIGGKLFFGAWAFGLPLVLHPASVVLACYALTSVTLSMALALVFQPAHLGDDASFPDVSGGRPVSTEWAAHQAESAINFGCENRVLTWYAGGLNFQIEHHLFPRVSHVHLPAIAPIVQQTCREFGVRYRAYPTMRAALRGHGRWMRSMGASASS